MPIYDRANGNHASVFIGYTDTNFILTHVQTIVTLLNFGFSVAVCVCFCVLGCLSSFRSTSMQTFDECIFVYNMKCFSFARLCSHSLFVTVSSCFFFVGVISSKAFDLVGAVWWAVFFLCCNSLLVIRLVNFDFMLGHNKHHLIPCKWGETNVQAQPARMVERNKSRHHQNGTAGLNGLHVYSLFRCCIIVYWKKSLCLCIASLRALSIEPQQICGKPRIMLLNSEIDTSIIDSNISKVPPPPPFI